MTRLNLKTLFRVCMNVISKSECQRRTNKFRHSVECLESRTLLSAVGCEVPTISSAIGDLNSGNTPCQVSTQSLSPQTVEIANHHAMPPSNGFQIKQGTVNIQSHDLGNGTLVLTQQGLTVTGVFNTPLLESGSFTATFKTTKAHQAKGATLLTFNDSPNTTYRDKITITFSKDGTFSKFKLTHA